MVQSVEKLGAKLRRKALVNRELLREIEIQIHQSGTAENADAGISEDAVGGEADLAGSVAEDHERAGIEPLVHGAPAVRQSAVCNAIGTEAALAADVHDLSLVDGE